MASFKDKRETQHKEKIDKNTLVCSKKKKRETTHYCHWLESNVHIVSRVSLFSPLNQLDLLLSNSTSSTFFIFENPFSTLGSISFGVLKSSSSSASSTSSSKDSSSSDKISNVTSFSSWYESSCSSDFGSRIYKSWEWSSWTLYGQM